MTDPLVRSIGKYQASGTSFVLGYAESGALDSSHLHVLIVQVASTSSIATPSGWTLVSSGTNGANQIRVYARQGDGSFNATTVAVPSAACTGYLMAFTGYVSTTPVEPSSPDAVASGTAVTGWSVDPNDYPFQTIVLTTVGVLNTVTWKNWSEAARVGSTTGGTSLMNASQRMTIGYQYVDPLGSTNEPGVSWTTSRTALMSVVMFPLATAASDTAHVAEYSFDEGTGTTAGDSSGNGRTITVDSNSWATGKNNGGFHTVPGMTEVSIVSDLGYSSNTSHTVSCWLKLDTLPPSGKDYFPIGVNDSTNTGWSELYVTDNGTVGFEVSTSDGSSAQAAQGPTLSAGTWYHLTGVFDYWMSSVRLFVNGTKVDDTSLGADSTGIDQFVLAVTGWDKAALGYTVDDVRVTIGAVADYQIAYMYGNAVPPADGGDGLDRSHLLVELGFNEGSGAALDSSGNGNDFAAVGSPWITAPSPKTGYAVSPTANDYFQRSSGIGSGSIVTFTAMVWFYRRGTTSANWGGIIWDSHTFYFEQVGSGVDGFDFNGDVYTPSNLPLNTWTHIAVACNAGALAIYINGTSVATGTWSGSPAWLENAWLIGTDDDGPSKGYIKDARIFDAALTANQIKAFMNEPVSSDQSGDDPLDRSHLIAEYGFNEGTGTTAHDSAGNYDVTVSSSNWTGNGHSVGGVIDQSVSNVVMGPSTLSARTVMMWVYPTSMHTGSSPTVWASTSPFNCVYFDSDGWGFYDDTTGFELQGSSVTLNTWTHVAAVASGTTVTIYVNGTQVASEASTVVHGATNVYHGSDGTGGNLFSGTVDDLRIFDAALTTNQIKAFMNKPVSSDQSGDDALDRSHLIAEYGLGEGTGTVAADSSGNGHDATAHGSPWTADGFVATSANYFTASLGASLPQWTVMTWVKRISSPDTTGTGGGWTAIIYDDYNLWFEAYEPDYAPAGSWGYNGWVAYPDGGLVDGDWHHLALTCSGDLITLYQDGVQVGTIGDGAYELGSNLILGAYGNGVGSLNAAMKDVRIFDTALTAADITAWMNTPVGGKSSRWFLNDNGTLVPVTPYVLTPGGLVELE